MDAIEKISEKRKLSPIPEVSDWLAYTATTKICSWQYCFRRAGLGKVIKVIVLRDAFDKKFLNIFDKSMKDTNLSVFTKPTVFSLCEQFRSFDSCMLLPPECHGSSKEFGDDIFLNTIVVCPIDRREWIDGDGVEVFLRVRDWVNFSDWNRSPTPRINVRFNNPIQKTHTPGDEFVPWNTVKAQWLLETGMAAGGGDLSIMNSVGSVIDFEFYRERLVHISDKASGEVSVSLEVAAEKLKRHILVDN